MTGDVFIQVRQASFVYHPGQPDAVEALRGIDLEVRRGEFLAVVGANGSGKSTLARLLNGLLLPTRGEVRVAGLSTSDPAARWEIRRLVGMVFQNPDNQLVAPTVEEDVAFGPENLGLPREEIARRVRAALEAVDLWDRRADPPHRLSGGQKQRVALAGMLAMEPACLVLDEATAMLDPAGRADVLAAVTRLHRERGMTVILITHFLEEAARAGRVVVMDRGRVVAVGPPQEVFARAGWLEAVGLVPPPMGRLAARLRRRGWNLPEGIVTVEQMVAALLGQDAAAGGGALAEAPQSPAVDAAGAGGG
ncbi:ABC transporter related protein [Thermaerobacter marianensis DSM 12885]|uniref:ABC transporter related protein n=1 Tax=Thermaerobacter marianensis (strain ATCC 700841 / DSM 12885 / JCM 10246 / 7p75a) TaxID=644966 RepID=E6SKX1_THEM7|nr:energy-coupling factor transporter ATPase [Thermaerobacter marianensis]ADU52344.1 ABC transporter related protein [Thermaerobacter marianensis DSM 12885]